MLFFPPLYASSEQNATRLKGGGFNLFFRTNHFLGCLLVGLKSFSKEEIRPYSVCLLLLPVVLGRVRRILFF